MTNIKLNEDVFCVLCFVSRDLRCAASLARVWGEGEGAELLRHGVLLLRVHR